MLSLSTSWRAAVALVTSAAFVFACSAEAPSKKKKRSPADPGDEFYGEDLPVEEEPIQPTINADSGAFGAPSRPAKPSADAGKTDGGSQPKVSCPGNLVAGD